MTASTDSSTGTWPTTRVLLGCLGLACIVRLAFMVTLPLVDPTEGRYAVIAQEMLLSGDWTTPRLWHNGALVPFLGKPPLFFWSSAAGMALFGTAEWAARLPSLAAAVALLTLLVVVLRRYADRRIACPAALMTAVSPVFFILSGAVMVDMVLGFFVAGSLLAYFAFARETDARTRRYWSLLVFILLAGGLLSKGPVAIILFGLPIFTWTFIRGKWSLLRHHSWGWGTGLFLALTVPWFWLCEVRNPGFLHYFFVNENLLRYLTHSYGDLYGNGHVHPRGTAIGMMLVAVLPWVGYAGWYALRSREFRSRFLRWDDVSSFLFIGFALDTLFWCLARQLLITYMVPMIPFFCAWLTYVWPREDVKGPARLPAVSLATLGLLLAFGIGAAVVVPNSKSTEAILECVATSPLPGIRRAPLTFVRHVPYSAYFYGRGQVQPHPKEEASTSVSRVFADSHETVLIAKEKYLREIPDVQRNELLHVTSVGQWHLLVRDLPLTVAAMEPQRNLRKKPTALGGMP